MRQPSIFEMLFNCIGKCLKFLLFAWFIIFNLGSFILMNCFKSLAGIPEISDSHKDLSPRLAYIPKTADKKWIVPNFAKARKQVEKYDTGNIKYPSVNVSHITPWIRGAKSKKYYSESKKYNGHADSRFAVDNKILDEKYKNAKLKEILVAWAEYLKESGLTA